MDKSRHSAALSDFQLLKTLGSGAFGTVYLARNSKTEEVVAIK